MSKQHDPNDAVDYIIKHASQFADAKAQRVYLEDRGITAKLYAGDRRMRIKQEILVAIAGVRLLKDFLSLNPAVYHLNEGHCAFIAVERYRRMTQQGYTPQDAFNSIKFSTVFTTHTPVAAGNETFDLSLMYEMAFLIMLDQS